MDMILQVLLGLITWLFFVPLLTSDHVHVRFNSAFRGLAVMVALAFINPLLWCGMTIITAGLLIPAYVLAAGVVSLLVQALAILVTGRVLPGILHVTDYWTALGAALVVTVASYFINHDIVPYLLQLMR